MQPFVFDAPDDIDPAFIASAIGASWRAHHIHRDGASVCLKVRQSETGVTITLAHNWHWPWRWPAAGRLERDVLKQLAHQGVRAKDVLGQAALDETKGT